MAHLPPIIARQLILKTTFSTKWPPRTHAEGGHVEAVLVDLIKRLSLCPCDNHKPMYLFALQKSVPATFQPQGDPEHQRQHGAQARKSARI
jgi:hypothetical protein